MTENSKIKILNPDFTDERGKITDIFVNSPKDHCCIITNNPGSIRANHYHKVSTQFTYVVEGELKFAKVKVNKDGIFDKTHIEITILKPGSLITHTPYEAHAFQSIGKSTILAFACGIRGGNDYENDVFRLKISLFD